MLIDVIDIVVDGLLIYFAAMKDYKYVIYISFAVRDLFLFQTVFQVCFFQVL
jgi:hypothetical protein